MGLVGARDLNRGRFYDDLATSLDAGLGAREALKAFSDRLGGAPLVLERRIGEGSCLAEAMGADGRTFTSFERHVVDAGERGGRLPDALRRLAHHFERRGKMRDRMSILLIYPLFLLHFAFVVPPLHYLVTGDVAAYLSASVVPIAMIWGAAFGALIAVRAIRRNAAASAALDALVFNLPVAGRIARAIALSEYSATLGAVYGAGIPAAEALASAASATRNRTFAAAGERVAARVRAGDRIHEALVSESRVFPRLLIESVQVGESTGRLEESLERVERTSREEADRWVTAVAAAVPFLVYLAVILFIAYGIISFWSNYAKQLQAASGG